MILKPFAGACSEFTESIGAWHQEGRRVPDPEAPATADWSLELDTMPWMLSGVEEADRHGLSLFDAALKALSDATRDPETERDYLAVTAGLRVVVEACAQAHWLLAAQINPVDRLERFGNLCLEDLAYDDLHHRALRTVAGVPATRAALAVNEVKRNDIIQTLCRLTGREAKGEPPHQYFGKPGSISARVEALFRPAAASGKEAGRYAASAYGVLSAPAHSSVGTIRTLYGPALANDQVVRERLLPPQQRVGTLLMMSAAALLQAQVSVATRFGWWDVSSRTTVAAQDLVDATLSGI